jgi:hypothetical protein
MVWIVEWTMPNQGDSNVTVYNSEKDALKCACADIIQEIGDSWDLEDEDFLNVAKEVNGYIGVRDYKSALIAFNEFQSDNSDYEGIQFWNVSERHIVTNIREPALMVFADPDEEEEEDEDEEDEEYEDEAYMATDPGATCRGPCGNFSPDAYADKQDGTFHCFQCKLMSQAFGGKSP